MNRNQKKFLFDIAQSIDNIFNHHISGIEDEYAFANSITAVRAVEREFGIIGEACLILRKSGLNILQHEKFINRRNALVHRYDSIKSQTLWQYIKYELPELKIEVENLLASIE